MSGVEVDCKLPKRHGYVWHSVKANRSDNRLASHHAIYNCQAESRIRKSWLERNGLRDCCQRTSQFKNKLLWMAILVHIWRGFFWKNEELRKIGIIIHRISPPADKKMNLNVASAFILPLVMAHPWIMQLTAATCARILDSVQDQFNFNKTEVSVNLKTHAKNNMSYLVLAMLPHTY